MKHLTVVRSYLPDATIGFIEFGNKKYQTLEKPWLNNEPHKSCIPEGTYLVERDFTGRWQYYSITNVPMRTFIEIHPANKVSELEGCLALGMNRADDNISLLHSAKAIQDLVEHIGLNKFLLTFRSFNPSVDSII